MAHVAIASLSLPLTTANVAYRPIAPHSVNVNLLVEPMLGSRQTVAYKMQSLVVTDVTRKFGKAKRSLGRCVCAPHHVHVKCIVLHIVIS